MKGTIGLLFLVVLTVLSCESQNTCEDHNSDSIYNSDVENYISLLKSNQYDSANLPVFSYTDIPALLKYRNEKQIITNFPVNPISSLMAPECSLGIFVLWTIESIRFVAIDNECLILSFPSQNPILALRKVDELTLVYDDESHRVASQAYYDWWYSNSCKNFNEYMDIDPLIKTAYKWH